MCWLKTPVGDHEHSRINLFIPRFAGVRKSAHGQVVYPSFRKPQHRAHLSSEAILSLSKDGLCGLQGLRSMKARVCQVYASTSWDLNRISELA